MLLASGRLLACGWECADELAAPAEASCHQESAPATAINTESMHACLPDIAEPRVTVAKTATAHLLVSAPIATSHVTFPQPPVEPRLAPSALTRIESPHPPAPSVLRV